MSKDNDGYNVQYSRVGKSTSLAQMFGTRESQWQWFRYFLFLARVRI